MSILIISWNILHILSSNLFIIYLFSNCLKKIENIYQGAEGPNLGPKGYGGLIGLPALCKSYKEEPTSIYISYCTLTY